MKHQIIGTAILASAILATPAHAESLTNVSYQITTVFAEGTDKAGFYTAPSLDSKCQWGIMYLELNDKAADAQLAMMLTTKSAGMTVSRMDYSVMSGKCYLNSLHIK